MRVHNTGKFFGALLTIPGLVLIPKERVSLQGNGPWDALFIQKGSLLVG